MRRTEMYPLPSWMRLDKRPMDKGERQPYGYGYSRIVGTNELWRPATRYIRRTTTPQKYAEIKLLPGAYYVSDHGRVYSRLTGNIICKRRTHRRKDVMLLAEDGSIVRVRKYRLALDNFVEPTNTYLRIIRLLADSVNHEDGKAWNDRLDNLQYSPTWMNLEHYHKILKRDRMKQLEAANGKKRNKS